MEVLIGDDDPVNLGAFEGLLEGLPAGRAPGFSGAEEALAGVRVHGSLESSSEVHAVIRSHTD